MGTAVGEDASIQVTSAHNAEQHVGLQQGPSLHWTPVHLPYSHERDIKHSVRVQTSAYCIPSTVLNHYTHFLSSYNHPTREAVRKLHHLLAGWLQTIKFSRLQFPCLKSGNNNTCFERCLGRGRRKWKGNKCLALRQTHSVEAFITAIVTLITPICIPCPQLIFSFFTNQCCISFPYSCDPRTSKVCKQ